MSPIDSPAAPGPANRPIVVSEDTLNQLEALAVAWVREERLPRKPTRDDVIRRLLAARDELAAVLAGQEDR